MIRYKQSIIKRIEAINGRHLMVVGDDYLTKYVFNDCIKMGLSCSLLQLNEIDEKQPSKDECFFLVAVYTNHKIYYEKLTSIGYLYEVDFTMMNAGGFCRKLDCIDPLLGYCRHDEWNQYSIIGDGKIKIMILGSSTSDLGEAGQLSWPYFLHSDLQQNGLNSSIYCGAVAGYCSGQELLKLIRDIEIIKPDLVISFSGINDYKNGTHVAGNPLINKYFYRTWNNIIGIEGTIPDSLDMRNIKQIDFSTENKNSDSDIWVHNEIKMNAICRAFECSFIAVLEPLICFCTMVEKELIDLIVNADSSFMSENYVEDYKRYVEDITNDLSNREWFFDCSRFFENQNGMYIDSMHYNQIGCEMVGKKISSIVSKVFEREN